MGDYKQCIIVRADLELSKGKLAAQAAHASILAYEETKKSDRRKWMETGGKKIVLEVESLGELHALENKAKKLKLPYALVKDAGLTEIPPGTETALGIGPCHTDKIDRITGHLKLL